MTPMIFNIILVCSGAFVGIGSFLLIKWMVSSYRIKKNPPKPEPVPKKEEPVEPEPKPFIKPPDDYIPKGRRGYKRVDGNGHYATIIVEEIDRIDDLKGHSKVKIKILEVSIDYGCFSTEAEILKQWDGNDWMGPGNFTWHEFTEAEKREKKIDGIVGEED